MIDRLLELVNDDAALVRRGRFFTCDFLVEVGERPFHVSVASGRIVSVTEGPVLMRPWRFAIRASADTWRELWQPVPRAGFHDLLALTRFGRARIEGDLQPLMANLRYVKEVLEAPRRLAARAEAPAQSSEPGSIEPIRGRYVHLRLGGRPCRVYFEEAGAGIPLLCLHTAGADGRQFRHLMNDPAVTAGFRVMAFDLPWHGKSTPPPGWHDEEYRLTTAAYVEAVMAFSRALRLERPVVMGCSMGGRIVLELAHAHGRELGGVIGLEAADHQTPWYDTAWLHRPDVHGGEVSSALVSGLVGATAPEEYRWDTLWGYMQSGPGVFKGDLYFYRVDSDFRDRVAAIDTAVCPVHLLTGSYDFSCTPEDTLRTAAKIKGASAQIMDGLGHFPMSEDPERFRGYLLPVLEKIRAARA